MLEGKVAIVTGAASGIGFAIAEELVKESVKVVLADINQEALIKQADRLHSCYKNGDLSKRESCKALVDYTIGEYGRADILVNAAGFQNVCPIEEFPEDKWDIMLSVMLTAPFLLTKYVWAVMKENKWGRIININSIHGLVASEFKSAYVAAKHGLYGLTKTAALEGAPFGITVNSICPAYVKTPLVEKQITDQAIYHGISEDEVVNKIMLQKSAIKKTIDLETITAMVMFLCSEEASTITGIAIPIDGGWVAA